ncbi:MAG: T9SS type A sorting domain-containing protein [Flavobacteriales bacterium]|nr:T9SS type A sorting domain-containing protein [Flavobacteriales bacterium]
MRAALLPLALLPLLACAQSWCPPGAQWEFYFGSQQAWGIAHAQYAGDTIIEGVPYQRIDHTIYAPNPNGMFGQPFVSPMDPLFTRYANDVVHIRNSWTGTDDTLMWFGAVPGDQWRMAGLWDDEFMVVQDTGRFLLEGEPLRWLVVNVPLWGPDTLRERIGFERIYLQPELSLMIDYTVIGLKCYWDDLLPMAYTGPSGWAPCQFTASVPSLGSPSAALPFPNPGTTHFTLELPPAPHTITLFDATGRMVLQHRTTDARPVIATEALTAGLYQIAVRDEQGWVMGAAWVKE